LQFLLGTPYKIFSLLELSAIIPASILFSSRSAGRPCRLKHSVFFLNHLSNNVTELPPSMSLPIHNNSTYHSALSQTRISLFSLKIPIGFYNKTVKHFLRTIIQGEPKVGIQ